MNVVLFRKINHYIFHSCVTKQKCSLFSLTLAIITLFFNTYSTKIVIFKVQRRVSTVMKRLIHSFFLLLRKNYFWFENVEKCTLEILEYTKNSHLLLFFIYDNEIIFLRSINAFYIISTYYVIISIQDKQNEWPDCYVSLTEY